MLITHPTSSSPARSTLPRHERDAAISARRAEGRSLQAIANEFGMTRERVRQIVAAQGGPGRREVSRVRSIQAEARREALRDRCLDHLEEHPGLRLEELAAALVEDAATVRAALGADAHRLLAPTPRRARATSDDELLRELRLAADLIRGPLTGGRYDRIARALGLHSRMLLIRRFGTWATACERAGVTPGKTRRGGNARRWSRGDMLDWVARYLAEPGSRGTYADFAKFARSTSAAPSAETVRITIGTWSTIRTEALRRGAPPALSPSDGLVDWNELSPFAAEDLVLFAARVA